MKDSFILWAQALDNTSPDHFNVHGRSLEPDDAVQRQEAVSRVSNVIKNGVRLVENGSVLLTADASHFVVEVPSAQRDRAGRTAPIVCYGDYDSRAGDALGERVAHALDNFAKEIGRTLQREHFELARCSFETPKKKSWTKNFRRVAALTGLAVLAVVLWLALKSG